LRAPHWISDQRLAFAALRANGLLLGAEGIKRCWANNEEAVFTAVKQNGLALEFAGEHLRSIDRILSMALRQNGLALAFAPDHLRCCPEYVEMAARQNFFALSFSRGCRDVEQRLLLSGQARFPVRSVGTLMAAQKRS
jgi:hypothetical protein